MSSEQGESQSTGGSEWKKKPGNKVVHVSKRGTENGARRSAGATPLATEQTHSTLHNPPYTPKPGNKAIRFIPVSQKLHRVLGVPGLFATGYGNVGSSIYYALGVTALFALGAAPLALTLAGVLFVLTVLTYTEATVALPEAGGASSFARQGLGELAGFFTGWVTMLSYTVTIAISAYTAGGYLAVFFPILAQHPFDVLFGVGAIAALMVLNIVGVQEAAGFSVIFALIDLLTQIVLVVVGIIFILNIPLLISQVNFGVAPTWSGFIGGTAIAMVAYTGIETISNMSGEARLPAKNVPRSYAALIFAVLVLFTGISIIALSAMPVQYVDGHYTTELATTYMSDPVAGIAHKLPEPFNSVLTPLVGVLATSILLIGANAGVIGVSRISYSMGSHRQIPAVLNRIHPRFHTPYVAIILFCIIAAGLAMSGSIPQMTETYIFAATFTFFMAHFALIGMRIKKPDLARPFRAPWSIRIRAREIPIPAVVGGLGCFAVWVFILLNNPFGRWFGLIWLVLGAVVFFFYRRHFKLPLNAPAPKPEQTWTKEFLGKPATAAANGGTVGAAPKSTAASSGTGSVPAASVEQSAAPANPGIMGRIARLLHRS